MAATDYYLWGMARSEYTLRGFWPRTLSGHDAAQEWVYAAGQTVTRVLRAPVSDRNVYGDKPPALFFPARITGA